MRNTYNLIWSDEALNNLKCILDYLEGRWTKKEITRFVRLLDKHLLLIKENPFLFPKSKNSTEYRKAVISKQVSLYYKISNNEIYLITLFDNRQNPQKVTR